MTSREPPKRRFSVRYESNGGGCGWAFWLSTLLGALSVGLTIVFGMKWL